MGEIDVFLEGLYSPGYIKKILDKILPGSDPADFVKPSPVTEKEIKKAEKSLGHELPPSYKKLVMKSSYEILTYIGAVVWVGKEYQRGENIVNVNEGGFLPDFLVAFTNTGDGNSYCFDTRESDGDGEYPIVFWDHETCDIDEIDEESQLEVVAPNLGSFLLQELARFDI